MLIPLLMYLSAILSFFFGMFVLASCETISNPDLDALGILAAAFLRPELYIASLEIILISFFGLVFLVIFGDSHILGSPVSSFLFPVFYMTIVKHFTGKYFLTDVFNAIQQSDDGMLVSTFVAIIWSFGTLAVFANLAKNIFKTD